MNQIINEKIIMGIDPGTNVMGFGIIKIKNNNMELIELNELNLSKEKDHYLKLSIIFKSMFLFIPFLFIALFIFVFFGKYNKKI